ncbi:hypothetical protein SH501x_002278 [Pirellulaceae bacterium SH501]
MPAVIRISGSRLELDQLIVASGLPFVEALSVMRKRRLNPVNDHGDTTYNLTISEIDGDAVPEQIDDSLRYLRANGKVIAEIHSAVKGSNCSLDFSWDLPTGTIGQYNTFPLDLIALLREYRIALRVSVYSTLVEWSSNPTQASGELSVLAVEDQSSTPVDR